MDNTITALRLVQKTSGLFDTAEAGDRTVAGEVSEPGFKVGKMEPVSPGPGESLGGLFQDMMPLDELPEVDYLDSFMDLSNFLNMDTEEKVPENDALVEAFGQEMTGKLDFSGILMSLKEEPDAFTIPSNPEVASPIPNQPLKRKLAEPEVVEEPMIGNVITIELMDTEQVLDSSTSDHDYVVKKPRLVSSYEVETSYEATSPIPVSSTSTIGSTAAPTTKYRERRDKNNAASRRSRQIRKNKYVLMEVEAEELAAKNDKMRSKIAELEKLAKFMKAELIKQMTKK